MRKEIKNILILNIILLILVIYIFEITDIDIYINNFLYNRENLSWIISSNTTLSGFIFYKGIKIVLGFIGIIVLSVYFLSFFLGNLKKYRIRSIFIFICMASVPLFVGVLKHTTNVYPPWDIENYGGDKPYIKLFESYPDDFKQEKKAQGWPAGHASGGFGILCFYFILKRKDHKKYALILWMLLGWSMGIYQMLRGAHFLSHTIVSNILSVIITVFIYQLFRKKYSKEFEDEVF